MENTTQKRYKYIVSDRISANYGILYQPYKKMNSLPNVIEFFSKSGFRFANYSKRQAKNLFNYLTTFSFTLPLETTSSSSPALSIKSIEDDDRVLSGSIQWQ